LKISAAGNCRMLLAQIAIDGPREFVNL
jgi:hypothetical protein